MLGSVLITLLALPVPNVPVDEPDVLPERQLLLVQGDLSFVGNLGSQSMAGGALYVGLAYGKARPPAVLPFGGFGLEITYAAAPTPYRVSFGLQARGGFALISDDTIEGRQPKEGMIIPDLFVYARASLFAAGTATMSPIPGMAPTTSSFAGVRAGLGLTSTWWMRKFFGTGLFKEAGGFWNEALRVGVTVLLLPIVLLDHTEVMFEFADTRPILTTVTFRVGAGF